ncbi:MAG: CPBP family intramembrane glutamic endopeptidase [Byssovorax sp.]
MPDRDRFRLSSTAIVWLAATRAALDYGALLLPQSLARVLSHEAFLTLAQLLTTALGLGLAAALLRSPRDALGLRLGSARSLVLSALAAPAVFVFAMAAGIAVALPTLLAELRQGGAAVSRQNVGELGRALESASLGMTLFWAVIVAPFAEELLFRGGVWSAIQSFFAPRAADAAPESAESLPPELLDEGMLIKAFRRVGQGLRGGGISTLVSAAIFGAMHLGMPGGSGIVRVVSATGLGLACGMARHLGGTAAAPLALHVVYNLLSVAHSRGWLVSEMFPKLFALPTLAMLIAAISTVAAIGVLVRGRLRGRALSRA